MELSEWGGQSWMRVRLKAFKGLFPRLIDEIILSQGLLLDSSQDISLDDHLVAFDDELSNSKFQFCTFYADDVRGYNIDVLILSVSNEL